VNAARIPGLILPVAFLVAALIGVVWYWRHRGE
jgi:hypothetical protein